MVISNLLIALALSTGYGLQAMPSTSGYSHVLGTACTYWVDDDFAFTIDGTKTNIFAFNLDTGAYGQLYHDIEYIDEFGTYGTFLTTLYNEGGYFPTSASPTHRFAYMFVTCESNTIEYPDGNMNCCIRFGVPYNSQVNGVELHNNDTSVSNYTFVYDSYCAYIKYGAYENDGTTPLYLGLYDDEDFYYQSEWHYDDELVGDDHQYIPYRFSNFGFVTNLSTIGHNYALRLHLSFLTFDMDESVEYHRGWSSGYASGKDKGYQDGYTDGNEDGYQVGYHDASQYYAEHNYTFFNLFGAIADTPIRMLYGLFNFDLFGMSMIAIVLTTLTAIILLGIIKKFIK